MKYRRDFSKKTFRNPHYAFQRKKSQSRRGGGGLILIACLVCINTGLYFLFFSPFFTIKNISVSSKTIPTHEVERLTYEIMQQSRFILPTPSNLLRFDSQALKKVLLATYPLESVEVKKHFFHTLEITLHEKEPVLVWITGTRGYTLDRYGKIISEIDKKDIQSINSDGYNIVRHKIFFNNIPIILQIIEGGATDPNITEKTFKLVYGIISRIQEKNLIKITYYEFTDKNQTFVAYTQDGWKIFFNLTDSIGNQIDRLGVILNNKAEVGKIVDYIDLRFGDKIFYK